jgi:hypothetical protein
VALVAVLLVFAGLVLVVVGEHGRRGRLPPNRWAGIRVPATTRSDGAWCVAHRAAGGPLVAAGAAGVAGGAAAGAVGGTSGLGVALLTCATAGLLVLVGAWRGIRATQGVP